MAQFRPEVCFSPHSSNYSNILRVNRFKMLSESLIVVLIDYIYNGTDELKIH